MRVRRFIVRLITLGLFAFGSVVTGQAPPQGDQSPIARLAGKKPTDFLVFRPSSGRYSLEYPKKDWKPVPGLRPVLVQLVYTKDYDALMSVEHEELPVALSPAEITQVAAELEANGIRRRMAGAAGDIQSSIASAGEARVIVVEYSLTSETGPRRVRQYMVVNGRESFRLICSASPGLFSKRDPEFKHMAATFVASLRPASSQ